MNEFNYNDFDYREENPKTYFAINALASAVKEEAKSEVNMKMLSCSAISGVAMALARLINGEDEITDGNEVLTPKDFKSALVALEIAIDFTNIARAASDLGLEDKDETN